MKYSILPSMLGLLLLPLLVVLAGCTPSQPVKPHRITVLQGAEQCAAPNGDFPLEVLAELSGRPRRGLLGGDGTPPPAAGRKVRVNVVPGSSLRLSADTLTSDDGGVIRFRVGAGNKVGDHYLEIIPEDAPEKKIRIRFIVGLELFGSGQEAFSGEETDEPLRVRLTRADGSPAVGIPVYFRVDGEGHNVTLGNAAAVTDEHGDAVTTLRPGRETGRCQVNIQPADPSGQFITRGITAEVLAMNPWQLALNTFAGLAVFIFGMKLMGDGLQKAAGERMRAILQFFSRNRYVALLAGAGVTAVIQSSSASTVMVIGFINAGLLNLTQAVGIIFGTNIGTTITAQIVSFDIAALAMPAIIAGTLLIFVSHRGFRGIGETVLGFGFLFFGMGMMSEELTLIGRFPSVLEVFRRFDCTPIDGIMPFGAVLGALGIGLAATMLIQSSSATTGILIALGAGGLINFYTAVPLLLGANIGTTITAQLAAIPGNRVGKQAALAHTLFNLIGTLIMLVFFYVPWGATGTPVFYYLVDLCTPGNALGTVPQNVPRHIANAHTLFNVLTAILLLPFIPALAKLCERLLPVKVRKIRYNHLDANLLENPAIALQQCVLQLRIMLRDAGCNLERATTRCFFRRDLEKETLRDIEEQEIAIDRMQLALTEYVVKITRRELSAEQSEVLPKLLHAINDVEKLADCAATVVNAAHRSAEPGGKLSGKLKKKLEHLHERLLQMRQAVTTAFEHPGQGDAERAIAIGHWIRRNADELENEHIQHLRHAEYDLSSGMAFLAFVDAMRKISGILNNLAERAEAIAVFGGVTTGKEEEE